MWCDLFVQCMYIYCATNLIVYKELSVAAWNYAYHNLEIVCNKFTSKS